MNRREWLELLALVAAAEPAAAEPALAQQGSRAAPGITKETLAQALRVIGLDFPEAQREMMTGPVNRAAASFEALRKIDVPLDTEPAFTFIPVKSPARGKSAPRFSPTQIDARHLARPKSDGDLAFLPALQLGALIRAHKISSVELTKLYLARLRKYAPGLNCVITYTEELAMRQAERADREIKAGKPRGPLHGVPWGAKDLFATRGIPTTWGAEPFRGQVLPYDATVIERLDKAGAVLIAKLSMGALAMGGLWFGGMTKTPWNTQLTSSGSSAGSASATAAGLVGFSLGTETYGSILTPSMRCGAAGLRPTYGRVSRYGAMGLCWTMDKVGPICRAVEDCAVVLHAIYGPDGRDGSVADVPLGWNPKSPVTGLRVGILRSEFDAAPADEKAVYQKALEDLDRAGLKGKPVELPKMDANPLLAILNAEASAAFDDLTRDGRVNQLRGQGPGDWPNSFRAGRLVPAVEYIRAQRARTLLIREMEKLMERWDVLVSPYGQNMLVTNLTGHPQASIPCGFFKGLPRGLVFTGRYYDEGTLLRAALAFESATGWHAERPKLDPT
jgi:Asp-tRNA(Asn)/Glu-tRNA(Gln) amidotransferase A subunit family amidase